MKKSNKLLLAGFLAVVLLISAIHISLYAKYKAGNFTIFNPAEDVTPLAMQSFPNVLFVSVRNVPNARVRFSDVAEVEKEATDGLQYNRRGDTLLISGSANVHPDDVGYPAEFYLPYNATLFVYNSHLSFEAGKKPAASNPVIYLQKSSAVFLGDKAPLRLGQVKLIATDSSTALFKGTNIADLDVRLSRSTIEYVEGDFGRLSIETDSLSRISLQSKHLLKANIKTIAPQ